MSLTLPGTAGNKIYTVLKTTGYTYSLTAIIPGGVTNTSGILVVPARLLNIALYVPAVAEVVVIMRAK